MMSRGFNGQNTVPIVAVLSLVTLCFLCGTRADGQQNAPSVLQFQRIGVPEGRMDEVGGKWLPIDRDEFQKTVVELNAKYRALYGSSKPNIIQGRYTAKFENRQLVSGSAELDITHPHAEPAYLPLSPLGLAVDSFRWKSNPAIEAAAGLLPTGGIGVFVSRSDTLTFLWSLRGISGTEQEHRFRLSLPKATVNELLLDLPQGVTPECADAIVSRTTDPDGTNRESVATVRWRIELGAAHETELRIVPTLEDEDRNRLVMARPNYDYRIGTTGLELRATFRLDIQHRPLRKLTLQVDPRLRLAAIQLGGNAIGFVPRVEADRQDQFNLDLPTSPVGSPHELTVTAYAPAVIDKPWQLPRLGLVDVLWRQGTASLDVVEPLWIGQLSWQGGLLRRTEPLPSPATGESRQFDLLSPAASCDLLLTRQEPQLHAQTGTTITLNDSIVASQFIAQLSASGGAVFSIPLQGDAGWIVDSIETDPPQIDYVEALRGNRGLRREIVLREPITPARPLKLVVKAHRRLPSARALLGLEMRPIALTGEIVKSRLTAVRAELPLQLDVSDDASLTRVTELSSVEKGLVAADGTVFRDGPDADRLRVVLRSEPPRYSGTISAEAIVESTKIRQSFLFQCVPMSSRVGMLRVRFSPTPSDNIQWTAVGYGPGTLTARRLQADGNEWEVRLRSPRSAAFEILATLTHTSIPANANPSREPETPRQPEMIVLASLPDAESQVGTIAVGTPDGSGFSLNHEGLKAIPTQSAEAARLPTLRATYRYAPAQVVMLQVTRHDKQTDPPSAWIWDRDVTSRVDTSGEVTHLILLRIENVGVSRLTVDLPENVILERVDVDGERIVTSRSETKLRIPLPSARRFPIVRLRYRQEHPPLGNRFSCLVAMPEFDLRCLKRSWRVWVPPGYQAATGNEPGDLAHTPLRATSGTDWEHRLIGFRIVRRTGTPWKFTSPFGGTEEAAQPSRRQRTLEQVQGFLGAFDSQLQVDGDNGPTTLTWNAAIAHSLATNSNDADALPLYIDRAAISDAGISPTTLVPSHAKSAINALRLSDLVFIGDNRSLILTTLAAQAGGDYGECSSVADRTFITKSSGIDGSSRLVPATDWSDDSSMSPRPWDDRAAKQSFTPLVGWTNVRLPSTSTHAKIVLYRVEMLETIGWASLFVAVACGIWMGRRRRVLLLATVVIAIVVALLVPLSLVPIARSVLLGLLAAVALLGLRRRVAVRTPLRRSDESLSFRLARGTESVSAGVLLAAVLFTIASNERASAQERLPMGADLAARVFRVYDPVDQDGRPTGPHIYVSRTLFESIDSLKMAIGARRFGAILTGAKYSLAVPDAPMTTMLPKLLAEFELVSLSAGPTTIRLPFDRDELQLLEATFDEQRVYPRWSQDGTTLEVDVETIDRHTLRFVIRPVLTSNAEGSGFDLRIPTVPNSQLSITGRDVAKIEPTSALGAITRTDDSVEAKLGPMERLAVHWLVSNGRSAKPVEFTTSQLIWVRAESQVVTVDTQFAFSILSGALTEVELLVDARLQLLSTDDLAQVTDTLTPDNAIRKIRYQFKRAYAANETVKIKPSFVMTDVGESGIVKRPLIRVASGVVDNPLLAVSTSPGIAASLTHDGDWPAVRPQDFAETWGTMQLPKEAIQPPTNESDWSLAVTPLAARLSNVDATELQIGKQRADITHDSQVRIADAPVLQLVLTVPVRMTVEDVKVLQEDVDFVRRFSKSPDGKTTIFLTAPVQGDARVTLMGSLPIPPRGQLSYTGIRLADSFTSERLLTVLRRPEVLVEVPPNTASRPADLTQPEHRWGVGERVVGVYDLARGTDSAAPDITLGIASNPAKYSGRLVTKLHSEEAQWSVTADLSLQVSEGVVDSVHIRLPRELTESLRLDPPLPYELRDVSGQSEPNVIITPPVAIDKEFHVVLNARLQTSPDGSISAPPIEVLGTARVDRFLVLPKRSAEQEIEWDIRGLEQPESDESQTTYEVRRRRMRAVVREVNEVADSPRLLLADIEVAWQPDASYVGVASYDLEPGELKKCDLLIPAGVDLLHATVDDVPALLQSINATTATLELGAERLPQRIAILFAGHAAPLATVDRSLTLVAPSLQGLKARKTLWAIRDPSKQAASAPRLAHRLIVAAETRQLRVGMLQELLDYNLGPVPQHRSHDLQRWRERWQQRLSAATAKPLDASSASVVSLRDGMKWPQGVSDQDDWTYCSFDGDAPKLTIIRRNRDFVSLGKQVAMALAICVAMLFVWKLSRYEGVRDAFSRWPHLPGVVIGLAWWLWLSPSAVGWLIAAIFLASSLRPAWRSRTMHRATGR